MEIYLSPIPGARRHLYINLFYNTLMDIYLSPVPGHEAPYTSIYSTIHLWKYISLLFPGMKPLIHQFISKYTLYKYLNLQFQEHEAPYTSIYFKIHVI